MYGRHHRSSSRRPVEVTTKYEYMLPIHQDSLRPAPSLTMYPGWTPAQQFQAWYATELAKLTFNSRPIIDKLSMAALERKREGDWEGMTAVGEVLRRGIEGVSRGERSSRGTTSARAEREIVTWAERVIMQRAKRDRGRAQREICAERDDPAFRAV